MMTNSSIASSQMGCVLLLVCIFTVLIASHLYAEDQTTPKASKSTAAGSSTSHPFCGLYYLYATMRLNQKEIDFSELLKPEYLGSRKGSSIAELKKAAEDFGLYTMPSDKLTHRELRRCPYQAILHVKSDDMSRTYDHYELFLGTETGQAKLFDPPEPVRLVPFRELAPRWDGNGLILSTDPIDLRSVFGAARKRLIMYVGAAIASILALHWAKCRLPKELFNTRIKLLVLSATQAGAFALVALLFGMLYHFANDTGLLANADATAMVRKAHAGNFIRKIGEKKVHKLLNADTVFVDARFARDYKVGHIEEAISVPVDANDVERRKAMANIRKDSPIVVYCQTSRCKYAEIVAVKLKEDGYSNISIFRGGWVEWVARNGRPKEAAK